MVRSEQDVWSYGFSTASIIGVAGEKRRGSCSETLESGHWPGTRAMECGLIAGQDGLF